MADDKELSTLIEAMVKDEAFAKKVLANPEDYQDEFNLSPRNVRALKATSFDSLTSETAVAGGCYYGG